MFRNKLKATVTLSLVFILVVLCGSALAATSTTIDNLLVTVRADKSRYDVRDTATVTVEVTNQNDFPVLDVSAEAILGKGLTLAKGTEAPPAKEIIIPGEKAQFVFKLSLFEIPAMGDNQSTLRDTFLLVAGLVLALILAIIYRKHIKKKILPLLLCLILISSFLPFSVLAQEANSQPNVVSLNVYFGTTSYSFSAKITYGAIDRSLSVGTLASDEEFFPAGGEYPVLFTLPVISALTLGDQDVAVYDSEGKHIVYLNDKGENGDEFAGDYIYSSNAKVSAPVQTSRDYFATVKGNKSNVLRFYYFDEVSEHDIEVFDSANKAIDELQSAYTKDGYTIPEKSGEAAKAVALYAQKLVADGTLILYELDNDSVWMKFSSGLELMYFPTLEGVDGGVSNNKFQIITCQPFDKANIIEASKYSWSAANKKLLSVPDDAARSIASELKNHTFSDDKNDEAVTPDILKKFGPNQIIIWQGHGWNHKKKGSMLILQVPYSNYKKLPENKRRGILSTNSGKQISISSDFFRNYIKDLSNSFIYLGTCQSGKDSKLADVLLKKGADVVIGNTKTIGRIYNLRMMSSIFENLLKRDESTNELFTLQQAMDAAKKKHGKKDPKYYGAKVVAFGDDANGYRLNEPKKVEPLHKGILSGTVLIDDQLSLRKARGVDVSLYKLNGKTPIAQVITDDQGRFELEAFEGNYTLRIAHQNKVNTMYIPITEPVWIQGATCIDLGSYKLVGSQLGVDVDNVKGRVSNAKTGQPIQGANITIEGGWGFAAHNTAKKAATNINGEFSIDLVSGYYKLTAQKNGFVPVSETIHVSRLYNSDYSLSMMPATLEGNYRIVLSWGKKPLDLDAHLSGTTLNRGANFHVYYQNKNAYDNNQQICDLDIDDTSSYGPETITLKTQHLEPYYYYVYNYSNDESIANSQATVKLYKGNRLIDTFHVPVNQGDGRYWNLFAVVNGGIVTSNTVSSQRDINYAD